MFARLLVGKLLFGCCVIFQLTVLSTATFAKDVHECDTLAAHPEDPARRAEGVRYFQTAVPAVEACQLAILLFPLEPRYKYQLGRALSHGRQYKSAFAYFEQAAKDGHAASNSAIGSFHESGEVVPKNYEFAFAFYQKAWAGKVPNGAFGIGWLYYKGLGRQRDLSEARKWFVQAAQSGSASGFYALGIMFDRGHGVREDKSEAFRLFSQAAEMGDKTAIGATGQMLVYGDGIEQDCISGLNLMRRAVQMKDEWASENFEAAVDNCSRRRQSAGRPSAEPDHRRYQAPTPRFCGRGPDGSAHYC